MFHFQFLPLEVGGFFEGFLVTKALDTFKFTVQHAGCK